MNLATLARSRFNFGKFGTPVRLPRPEFLKLEDADYPMHEDVDVVQHETVTKMLSAELSSM
jgi:hypothetical protein